MKRIFTMFVLALATAGMFGCAATGPSPSASIREEANIITPQQAAEIFLDDAKIAEYFNPFIPDLGEYCHAVKRANEDYKSEYGVVDKREIKVTQYGIYNVREGYLGQTTDYSAATLLGPFGYRGIDPACRMYALKVKSLSPNELRKMLHIIAYEISDKEFLYSDDLNHAFKKGNKHEIIIKNEIPVLISILQKNRFIDSEFLLRHFMEWNISWIENEQNITAFEKKYDQNGYTEYYGDLMFGFVSGRFSRFQEGINKISDAEIEMVAEAVRKEVAP